MRENRLEELEQAIGYRFRQPELLVRALTHRSAVRRWPVPQGPQSQRATRIPGRRRAGNDRQRIPGSAVPALERGAALQEPGETGECRLALARREALGLGEHLLAGPRRREHRAAAKSRRCSPTRLRPCSPRSTWMAASAARANSSIGPCLRRRPEAKARDSGYPTTNRRCRSCLQARGLFRRRDIAWCAKRARITARRFGSRSASRAW